MSKAAAAVFIASAIITLVAAIGIYRNTSSEPSGIQEVAERPVHTSEEIAQAFDENEIAARQRFGGATIRLSERPRRIRQNSGQDFAIVVFDPPGSATAVEAHLTGETVQTAAAISTKRNVQVVCHGAERGFVTVRLLECELDR